MVMLAIADVPFTSLAQILPFILIGIGVDDMVSASVSRTAVAVKQRRYFTGICFVIRCICKYLTSFCQKKDSHYSLLSSLRFFWCSITTGFQLRLAPWGVLCVVIVMVVVIVFAVALVVLLFRARSDRLLHTYSLSLYRFLSLYPFLSPLSGHGFSSLSFRLSTTPTLSYPRRRGWPSESSAAESPLPVSTLQ